MSGRREAVDALRAELHRRGLAGFVVPRADEHQGEYVPPSAARLTWLTGFAGSAGLAVLLLEKAAVFSDGRYMLQMPDQVDTDIFECRHISDDSPTAWIAAQLPPGGALGYDPWLHVETEVHKFEAAAHEAGGHLVACEDNPLDTVWSDRPAPPAAPIIPHDITYTGRESTAKRRELAATLVEAGHATAVLTLPDSIAWLLNMRGGDVAHTPLPLCFALLDCEGRVELFVDPAKPAPGLSAHLGNEISLAPPEAFGAALGARAGKTVLVDAACAPAWVLSRLDAAGAEIVRARDPCILPKACKNKGEIAGMRAAHRRDARAMANFLAWLDREGPRGQQTERSAAAQLHRYRETLPLFRGLSFPTISGAGPNGAVVHYSVTAATDRTLAPDMLYLVDSGAQFLDGTTDVTRTIAIGTPTGRQRTCFTRVLKGHIALATARFPEGTTGAQLDTLARAPLWQGGLDFDHGTGHGVGSYLSVHEGPQRIARQGHEPLRAGMIVSNEPGYYEAGAFGIRIENLLLVREDPDFPEMMSFETLTFAPIDRRLVDTTLLTATERDWLNAYHMQVRETTACEDPLWLEAATAPI
ncbi:MAG: aminopeptidase family protein P [Alphaproteobacteria bacterium]|nr:aminopeptidase family protein P [Alphaproteobacteria bacterium]